MTDLTPRLRLHFSAQADLYFLLRHLAAVGPATAGDWADVAPEAQEVFSLVERVPPQVVDGYLAAWPAERGSPAEVGIEQVPAQLMGAPVRSFIVQAARLMESVGDRYEGQGRARREEAAAAALASIRGLLPPETEAACLDLVCDTFAFGARDVEIPVAVVASGVPLGGLTGEGPDDAPFCVVGAQALAGTLLVETVIHEATHALGMHERDGGDDRAGGSPVARLREASLAAAGGGGPFGQLWHVPYFVTAAEAVRRFVDPTHVPYGDARGYYGRVGRAAEIVVPVWTRLLAGDLDLTAAVDRIIEATRPAPADERAPTAFDGGTDP